MMKKKTIVIVGGGAGGLELVARLARKNKNEYEIILIDNQLKHIWKPLYHEIAAGTFSHYQECIDYISYSHELGVSFFLGKINEIDRMNKRITLASYIDNERDIIIDERKIEYDVLVIAVGSQIHDFNIPGVKENCLLLDDLQSAESCNKKILNHIIQSTQARSEHINISIVGAGATGVELAAELQYVLSEAKKYLHHANADHYSITLIEAGNRILGMMNEKASEKVHQYLNKLHIRVLTNTKILEVKESGAMTADGQFIESNIIIWAAGVKGNMQTIKHDLEVNKINQLVVKNTLQTTKDDSIFAFGDCASCPQTTKDGKIYFVPPRAQAAHQQAAMLVTSITNYLNHKPVPTYIYKDYGSLISLSHNHVIGNLMSKIAKSFYIEGLLARLAYWSLYKKHLMVLKGKKYVLLSLFADLFNKKQHPMVKLH